MRWTLLLSLSAAVTLAAGKVSTNARCGNAYNALPGGMTCKGSKWGDCCSQYGYCGKTKDYCGTGCQSSFGTCNGVVATARTSTVSSRSSTSTSTSTRTALSTAPSTTPVKVKITTNARCGNLYGASPAGMTCSGGKYGDCCSQYSYCGSGSAYCGTGCQAGFGKCDAVVSSARSSASSSSSSSFSSASSSTPVPVSTSSSESNTITASSSLTSSSSTATSSSSSLNSGSTSETTSSAFSSSLSSSDSSTLPSSSSSSEISVTPEAATSTITSTPTPSPSTAEFCGTKGYIKEQPSTFTSSPFTTIEDCLANCRAESRCGSVIISLSGCYLNESPITSTNIDLGPGSPLAFYNRECGISTPVTTTLPVTPATSTTSSSTISVSPTATELCGVEGIDNINLQVIKASPFTTNEDCLSNCRAESECGSFIIYSNTCYLARIPITATNVDPRPGSGLTYYNRDCGTSAPATTAAPTTLATSTSTSTTTPTPTPSVCVPAAPTVSCVKYPNCPQFTTPLSNACSANNSQCKDNYFVRCENIPAAGSQVILALGGIPNADVCRQRCDALNNCSAFAFKSLNCILYSTVNGFISDSATTFIRICADSCAGQPVKRGEDEKGSSDKSVSIAKWTQGKKHRGPKDT